MSFFFIRYTGLCYTYKRRKFMENKNPRHLFHKLFLSYSTVLILIVGVLILFFISSSRTRLLETNQDYAGKLCGEAVLEVSRASSDADYLHRAVYQNSSELQDLLNYFRYDTEEYLRRHLDTYASSNTLDNKDIYSYVENAYSAYPNIKKIEFISYNNNKTTVFYSENDIRVNDNGRERRKEILDGGLASAGSYSFQKEIRDPLSMRVEGCVIFTFDTGEMTELQEKYPMAELYLYYKNGNQVYPGENSLLLDDFQQEDAGKKLKSYIQIQSVEDYIVATRLDKHTAASIPAVHILAILGMGIALVIAGEILISSYLKRLSGRLDGILQGMNQVQTGNLKVQLPENEHGDELDMISRHFNLMCQELESYIRKSYLAEIEQQNAEMQALQSQINPHFLYNTLEAIRMKAICNGDREVGKMLYSLAVTFRSQLKEADVITLMQEMHYCKKYLELFEYRYQGKFHSSVECGPELSNIPVIKFILQPIIENYFIHGIRMEGSDNEINIYARRAGEDLFIHVEDNGRGMPEKDMESKNRELANNEMDTRKSIGVTNVNRRLKAAYGDTCGVFLTANHPRGMHVILKVKVKERETDEESNAGGGRGADPSGNKEHNRLGETGT